MDGFFAFRLKSEKEQIDFPILTLVSSVLPTIHMILLIRRVLCFYNQTNEYNLKIILVVRFSSWFLYIGIEQMVWIILMFNYYFNLFTVFLVLSLVNLEGDF